MPVLARMFEAAGISTVLVTNMPVWAERIGVPRTLAVELPFGHLLGRPGDAAQQTRIVRQALEVLERADVPGVIVHSDERWPGTEEEAQRASHPESPPPIGAEMGRHLRSFFRALKRDRRD